MSTILKQPDALSFSGNIKPFVISSTTEVVYELRQITPIGGDTIVLSEKYQPDAAGMLTIVIQPVIDRLLEISIPTTQGKVTEQTVAAGAVGNFFARIDNVAVPLTVIKGGVAELEVTAETWLATHWLTWQPQEKEVLQSSPEWLGIFPIEVGVVRLKAYFSSISNYTGNYTTLAAGKSYSINTRWDKVTEWLLSEGQTSHLLAWDVWFEVGGIRKTPIQRYQLRNAGDEEHGFVWTNTLGGIDSTSFTGSDEENEKLTHFNATYADQSIREYSIKKEREIRQSTGYLDNEHCTWLKDFFVSRNKYMVRPDGLLKKIALIESEIISISLDDERDYAFTYRFGEDTELLNLSRNQGQLPAPGGLDPMIPNNNGEVLLTVFYNSAPINNLLVEFYDAANVKTLNITSPGVLLQPVAVGVYSVKLFAPAGYLIDTITMTDSDNTDNVITGNVIHGVTIASIARCDISVTLVPEIITFIYGISINNGDDTSFLPNMEVSVDKFGVVDEYMISTSPLFTGSSWLPYPSNNILPFFVDYISEIVVAAYVKLRNIKGVSETAHDDITLGNGIHRDDSVKSYNSLDAAIEDIYTDYSGILTQNVTINCTGRVTNKRTSGAYFHVIEDFNNNSQYALIINGNHKLSIDCVSLGGIKIKHSSNIILRGIEYVNVGTELTATAPEELSAVFVQGTQFLKCENIIISGSTVDCSEGGDTSQRGSYAIIAKNCNNLTISNCAVTNAAATVIKVSAIENLNIVKNTITGVQVYGIVSQPSHISAINCFRAYIADNDFNGNTFDTGLIIDAKNITLLRNKFHGFSGECIRISNSVAGELLDVRSNVFYNNLLNTPYYWVKYTMIINNNFKLVRFVSNTCEMRGINSAESFECLIKTYQATLDKLIFSNNIVYFNCGQYPGNTSGGNVLSLENLLALESDNNVYVDNSTDGMTVNTPIITTFPESVIMLRFKKNITELNALGYEINSKVISKTQDLFFNPAGYDYHLTANGNILAARISGIVNDTDKDYRRGSSNAGAYGYGYAPVDETDVSTDYKATNFLTGEVVLSTGVISVNSSELVMFETLNVDRTVMMMFNILNSGDPAKVYTLLGASGMVNVFSNLEPDGTYLSDASYDIDVTII